MDNVILVQRNKGVNALFEGEDPVRFQEPD